MLISPFNWWAIKLDLFAQQKTTSKFGLSLWSSCATSFPQLLCCSVLGLAAFESLLFRLMLCAAKARLKGKANFIWNDANFGAAKPLQLRTFSLNSRDHAFAILGLKTFSEAEVAQSFARLKSVQDVQSDTFQSHPSEQERSPSETVNIHKGIEILAKKDYSISLDQKTINKVSALVTGVKIGQAVDSPGNTMNVAGYQKKIHELGEKLDPRVWNIGLSFLCTGKHRSCRQIHCSEFLTHHHSSHKQIHSILPRHQCGHFNPLYATIGVSIKHPAFGVWTGGLCLWAVEADWQHPFGLFCGEIWPQA